MRGGIEVLGAIELKGRAMELIGSRLGHDADDRGRVTPELRAEVVGLHAELAEGVRIGNRVTTVAQTGHVEAAVEVVGDLSGKVIRRTVDVNMHLWEAQAVRCGLLLNARDQVKQRVGVAAYQWQVVNFQIGYRAT